jgi:uncharacterized protein with PQ loop repeat
MKDIEKLDYRFEEKRKRYPLTEQGVEDFVAADKRSARNLKWADRGGMLGLLGFYTFHVVNLLRTHAVAGLCLPAFLSLFVGCVGFTALGILTRKVGLTVANGIACVVTALTIYGIVAWG